MRDRSNFSVITGKPAAPAAGRDRLSPQVRPLTPADSREDGGRERGDGGEGERLTNEADEIAHASSKEKFPRY